MPVEHRPNSKWWYGRYELDGRRHCINLRVRVRGERPSREDGSLGDEAFHASKTSAEEKFKEHLAEIQSPAGAARLIEKVYELKTGIHIDRVPIAELSAKWLALPRRRPASKAHMAQCGLIFRRFAAFLAENHAHVQDLARVTPAVARAFMDHDAKLGVSAKTWNDHLQLLRSACRKLLPAGAINPFIGIPTRATEPIFRQPFSKEELSAILQAAESDPAFRPVIIAGMCTAMRRGDCCTLRWRDVDLKNRFLNVKTAKTGQTVAIPIFPMLLAELQARRDQGGEYVFPDIAAEYRRSPINITRRTRRIFARAGFKDPDERPPGRRGPKRRDPGLVRGNVTVAREEGKGKNRVSIRDFHSFRVTWVTLALTAGVPLELVQKVTGHKTAEIVLKHYFQPGREAFRTAIEGMAPAMLDSPAPAPLRQQIEHAIRQNAEKLGESSTAELLALASKIPV